MTTRGDYATRHREILDALRSLNPAAAAAALPGHLVDQMHAAAHEARTMLLHVGHLEHTLNPRRFRDRLDTSNDRHRVTDMTARVLAAMVDGHWHWCPHLRRTPAQPTHVQLALRRVVCNRCAVTVRRPPDDEADRCDLCGSRGNVTFWPIRFALTAWLVIGDMCRSCATEIQPDNVETV